MAKRARIAGNVEKRTTRDGGVKVDDGGSITGLAAPFNSPTMIGQKPWGFREKIAPGAFKKALSEGDCIYLDNHNTDKPVARQSAGTLNLRETERGLEYEATPADTSYARDLVENIRAGNIKGNSFGFEAVNESWAMGDDGVEERTLLEVKLPEISACTFPAYTDTDISARDSCMAAREAYEARTGRKLTKTTFDFTDLAAQLLSAYNALQADERESVKTEARAVVEALRAEPDSGDDDKRNCKTCKGSGKILANTTDCPDCKGKGKLPADSEADRSADPKPDTSTSDTDTPDTDALRRRLALLKPRA